MRIIWEYKPNTEREEVFCVTCTNLTDTPYFVPNEWEKGIICLRCARVLVRCYEANRVEIERPRPVFVPCPSCGCSIIASSSLGVCGNCYVERHDDYNVFEEECLARERDMGEGREYEDIEYEGS